jgi:hypothetical protein
MSGAYDSRAGSLAHIHHVRDNIGVFVAEMLRRGRIHDASKLSDVEKPRLDEVLPMLEGGALTGPLSGTTSSIGRPTAECSGVSRCERGSA